MCHICNNTIGDPCKKCGQPECTNICTCSTPDYSDLGCETNPDIGCVILKKKNIDGSVKSYPCLGLVTGDTGQDFLDKADQLLCSLTANNGKVLVDSTDNCPQYLSEQLVPGSSNVQLVPTGTGCNRKLELIVTGGSGSDEDKKVSISATDTTPGYLEEKLLTSACVTWVKMNTGLNEQIRAVIDWNCVLTNLIALPGFCTAVVNCYTTPPVCGQVTSINAIAITNTSITYTWTAGVNNSFWNVSLYTDAGLTQLVAGSAQNSLSINQATFTSLTANTQYWIKIQAICINGGTVAATSLGPVSTRFNPNGSCPTVQLNAPIVVNNDVTVSWTSSGGATSYNVYLNNVLITSPSQPQVATSVVLNNLANGNYAIRVEALPCSGVANSDVELFSINYTEPCVAPSNVILEGNDLENTCPTTFVNLNDAVLTVPPGVSVEWHSNNSHTNQILNPTTYGIAGTVYVFTKDNVTGCYSSPSSLNVIINNCNANPVVTLPCPSSIIASSTFNQGSVSNGTVTIPISVTSGGGNIQVIVSNNGFSNNGVFVQNVNPSTTSLVVPVTYDGTGAIGSHNVMFTILNASNSPVSCSYLVPVSCAPCVLIDAQVTTSGITNSGFTVNVAGLSTGACVDTYDIVIKRRLSGTILQSATNQVSSYIVTGATANTLYDIEVTKNCCCGNTSAMATASVTTLV